MTLYSKIKKNGYGIRNENTFDQLIGFSGGTKMANDSFHDQIGAYDALLENSNTSFDKKIEKIYEIISDEETIKLPETIFGHTVDMNDNFKKGIDKINFFVYTSTPIFIEFNFDIKFVEICQTMNHIYM